jgi:HAD superfamily hydrolase (TIGR01509 family)
MIFCPDAIIFDMDGLLVDSEPVWNIAERAVIEARGKIHDMALQAGFVGMRLDEYWSNMARVYQLEDEIDVLVADAVNRMRAMIAEHVHPRPGASDLIRFALEHRLPIAIASSSPVTVISAVVEAKGWNEIFSTRVSGDEVARGKPAPDVYLEAARRLGVDPVHTLALEDSVNGARAAVAAGMTCYAVPDPTHAAPADFVHITPHVVQTLHEVRTMLEGCRFPS